jgi:predicted RNase H-like nuclease (RuvC/YqgF family)
MTMKLQGFMLIAMVAIAACNNSGTEEMGKIKSLAQQDSVKAVQSNQKDSLITAYLDDLNDIEENLDRIKEREGIITMNSAGASSDEAENKRNVVDEIKELDDWIVANDKQMNNLQLTLKRMGTKNTKLENLVAHLTQETAEKDEEISELQTKLGKADDSVKLITARFNDSIRVIKNQRAQMAEMNTVYYIAGTMKELKDKGIIDKKGGFIGVGQVAALSPSVNSAVFMKTNLINLQGFSLHGKFRRFITTHPDKSYKIISVGKTDSIAINMPSTFWSESKYLVIATK